MSFSLSPILTPLAYLSDVQGSDSNMANLKRPYCDEFLAAVWPHYDIVVWSQTSWRWLELKLTEMGVGCPHLCVRLEMLLWSREESGVLRH